MSIAIDPADQTRVQELELRMVERLRKIDD